MSTLGKRLREARENKGLMQHQLAKLIGAKSAGVISNWENGLNKPDVAICKLEQVLYWHNLKVFNALYQNKCPRLLEYVEIAKQYQLEPNDCVKYMIEE